MTNRITIYQLCIALLFCLVQTAGITVYGQDRPHAAAKRTHLALPTDTLKAIPSQPTQTADSLRTTADSITASNKEKMLEMTSAPNLEKANLPADSLPPAITEPQWAPNPVKATWLALVIPGGGQIYNRKFWKLPIIYGGFAGCAYALTWNNKMYKDYSSAYTDAANENWTSNSITDLLPSGYLDIVSKSQLTEILRKRKNTYRRYRDMSIFAFIGVYLLSVVDAYVDAELSNFDLSPDLSMQVEPTMIDNSPMKCAPINSKAVGMQCRFRF